MYSDKRLGNLRGVKRKLAVDKEDEDQCKPKTKFKEPELNETRSADRHVLPDHNNLNEHASNHNHDLPNKRADAPVEFNNNHLNSLNSNYSPAAYSDPPNQTFDDLLDQPAVYQSCKTELIDELTNELVINDELDELNNNELSASDATESSFNTFLNSSLNACYVNSRPLTPLPQTSSEDDPEQQITEPPPEQQLKSNIIESSPQMSDQQATSSNDSSSSGKENQPNLSPLNNFPALISNTKLFNSSSSLFNAAAIVDTYFSSKTKKSKLEKAKNMNHFRYSLFNKSLAKLNKFCNSSDPNIRNSVLVCNTLKRLERQLRKENIFLHLGPNGLAFVKLKNKRSNPEHLDYRNLVLDEASQIYVEKNEHSQSDDEEDEETDEQFDKFGIDTDLDFNAAKANETSSSSSGGSDSESDDLSDDLNEIHSEESFEAGEMNTDIISTNSNPISHTVTNTITSTIASNVTLCNTSELNGSNDLSTYLASPSSPVTSHNSSPLVSNGLSNDSATWSEESNQYSWTNMFTNSLVLSEVEQAGSASKENELTSDHSNYLFNSIEQVSATTNDEIFSDIDSLITLYDLDLLSSVNNSTKETIEQQTARTIKPKSSINSQDSSDEGGDTLNDSLNDSLNDPLHESLNDALDQPLSETLNSTMFSMDSAIGLSSINSSLNSSINSSISSSINGSLNGCVSSSVTSCSTSASVTSSSTSFPSNQANTQISPVIS